jgi:hypothetical protein
MPGATTNNRKSGEAADYGFGSPSHLRQSSVGSSVGGGVAAPSSEAGSVRSGAGGSGAYDPVGDRSPGNPLFPSNFARLAVAPTLRAKYVLLFLLKIDEPFAY